MNYKATYKALLKRVNDLDNGLSVTIGKKFYWLEYHNGVQMVMSKYANVVSEYEYRECLRSELEKLAR